MASLLFPRIHISPLHFLLAALIFISAGLRAEDAYVLRDSGKSREFVVATDELHLVRPGASAEELRKQVNGAMPGAVVEDVDKGRALLKVPTKAGFSTRKQASDLGTALPGVSVEAVLYLRGGERNKLTRRIATADVLVQTPAGTTPAALGASVGATGTQATIVAGRQIFRFPSGFHALEAEQALRVRGIEANVQVRRQHQAFSAPNDALFPNQWHLRNAGQGGGVVGVDANVIDAWDITKGGGVTLAVVDDGLQTTHPDLDPNCPPLTTDWHHDFNGDDNDPAPDTSIFVDDKHGTSVGGVAAAKGNNSIGVSGGAPDVQLVGLRLISSGTTDFEDASALYWHPAGLTVGVSNSSWGPTVYYAGADILTKQALRDAATLGRGGKGQITLFAAGNSQMANAGSRDANANSFDNSRFVISVAASNNFGEQCTYSQRGANVLVCAPSSDPFRANRLGIWTTDNVGPVGYNPGAGEPSLAIDPQRAYTNSFGGTSSASPLTAGCAALMIAAAPELGWRDVHEILAATAVQLQPNDTDWVINGGGFKFNHKFGGGMVNATAAVVRGMDWTNLGPEQTQSRALTTGVPVAVPDNDTTGISRTFDFTASPNLRVERAEIVIKLSHVHRSDVEMILTSPDGTPSILSELRPRPADGNFYDDDLDVSENGQGWTFSTTHSWGENSTGVWTLRVRDLRSGTAGTLDSATVRLYGTEAPLERVAFETPLESVGENDGSKTVRVRRVGAATGAFSVDLLASTHGTATSGQDFQVATQTLDFAAGEQFKEVTVDIQQDLLPEADETIYLLLRNPVGVALGGVNLETIKIIDDESNPVTIVATDAEAAETGAGLSTNGGTIVVSRAVTEASPLIVDLAVGGTATANQDYIGASTTVTIPAFQTSATFNIAVLDDGGIEGTESIEVTVLPSIDYDVGTPATAIVNIRDNELPSVEVAAEASSVAESSTTSVNFVISRPPASPNATPLIVKFQTEGTAAPDENYVELPFQVEIPAGASSVNVPLQPKDDDRYIQGMTVVLRLAPSPDYSIGFKGNATIAITDNDAIPDVKIPTVKIAAPRNKARVNVPSAVTASGSASDNLGVTRVVYQVNDSPLRVATGTTSWTADLTADLKPGPNKLTVQSEDSDGNQSKPAVVTFSYVQARLLSVTIDGNGEVLGGFVPQATLEAGQTYKIVAKPAAFSVFAGWTGDLSNVGREFTFVMPDEDTQLVAHFTPDPFAALQMGTYTGEVRTADFSFQSCGLLQMTVNKKGACTGKLHLGGTALVLKGEFNGEGRYRATVIRKGLPLLVLDLTLDVTGVVQTITGTVTSPDFSAAVLADRAAFSKQTPYPLAATHPKGETYTFVIPALTSPATTDPRGIGYGSCTIDSSGNAKWTATLPDGTVVGGATPLNKNLRWSLFASPYKAKGIVLGSAGLNKVAAPAECAGEMDWFKPAEEKEKYFPKGFKLTDVAMEGCLYTPPAKGGPLTLLGLAPFTDGKISLKDGNLTTLIERTVALAADNKATVSDAPVPKTAISLKFDAAKGVFSGTFLDPKFTAKKTVVKFGGVVLQSTNEAQGSFLGSTVSGTALQTGTLIITGP